MLRRLVCAVVLLVGAQVSFAQGSTGSGTVKFEFTTFSGPIGLTTPAILASGDGLSGWSGYGTVNGIRPEPTGQIIPWVDGAHNNYGDVLGTLPQISNIPVPGFAAVVLQPTRYGELTSATSIQFQSYAFQNVAQGQDFSLGKLTFVNGDWFGAGGNGSGVQMTPTEIGFRITTTSDDPNQLAFNQVLEGKIVLHVSASNSDLPAGEASFQGNADWITIEGDEFIGDVGAFRVYESGYLPDPNTQPFGSIELIGQFNSLHLMALANPTGNGFLTTQTGELFVATVPEPETYVLMFAGLAVLGGAARRRVPAYATQ